MTRVREEALAQLVLEVWAGQGRQATLPVQGYSMWPVLRPGDAIAIRLGGSPPRLGEIVALRVGGRTVAHRVVRRRKHNGTLLVRTKGDSNFAPDAGWIGPDQVLGVVEQVLRNGVSIRRWGLGGAWSGALVGFSSFLGLACLPLTTLVAIQRRLARGRDARIGGRE
jgi:signal peptidase I